MEQWKKMVCSDESRFLLYHVGGLVRVHHLPVEEKAAGCTMGRMQVDANALQGNVGSWQSCGC